MTKYFTVPLPSSFSSRVSHSWRRHLSTNTPPTDRDRRSVGRPVTNEWSGTPVRPDRKCVRTRCRSRVVLVESVTDLSFPDPSSVQDEVWSLLAFPKRLPIPKQKSVIPWEFIDSSYVSFQEFLK